MAATTTTAPPLPSYAVVTLDRQKFVECPQVFPAIVSITTPLQVITGAVALPGVANFLLRGLARGYAVQEGPFEFRFRFRLGNSDGATWYFSGGVGDNSDRILDTLCFGSGPFPYVVNPPIAYSASAHIRYEIEDLIGFQAPPGGYTIYLAFHGTYLIPVAS